MRRLLLCCAFTLACSGTQKTATQDPPVATCEPDAARLLIDWPAADRASLETLAKSGGVAVEVAGCKITVLSRCRAPGAFAFVGSEPKREIVRIGDQRDLSARVPIGAIGFSTKLASAGALEIELDVSGTYQATEPFVSRGDLDGDCASATHVISALTVGAFVMRSGSSEEVRGGVSALSVGVGVGVTENREVLAQDGQVAACAAPASTMAPVGCSALLRAEIARIGAPAPLGAGRCASGLVFDGLVCARPVTAQTVACPAGTELVSGVCVARVDTQCPTAMHFEGGRGCVADAAAPQGVGAMVEIGAGVVSMPADKVMGLAERKVAVAAFAIDRTEVTVAAYRRCVADGKCPPPVVHGASQCSWGPDAQPDHPVTCINLERAAWYCEYAKKRLPTEEEWALAAGFPKRYPWGTAEPGTRACWRTKSTCAVGAHPEDRGPSGALDLAGNAAEWTSTTHCSGKSSTCDSILRGGSWTDDSPDELLLAKRTRLTNTMALVDFGIRCARSLDGKSVEGKRE